MLEHLLVSNIFAFLLIFTRVGSGIMIMPGLSEAYINIRTRLILALMISLAVMPAIQSLIPPTPDSIIALIIIILQEMLVGLMIGSIARFTIGALHTAGSIISSQSSLSIASQFDLTQTSQGSIIGNFISLTAIVMMFSLNLHYVMIHALTDSYSLFMVGTWPNMEVVQNDYAHLIGQTFALGVKLSMPVIVIGLLIYMGAGILSRLMPNMQVFNIMMPAQVLACIFVLMAVLNSILTQYQDFFSMVYYNFMEVE